MDGEKLSKSAGNSFTLDDVIAHGIDPLALRYLYLQAHYRSPLSFTWESLEAASEALSRLKRAVRALRAVAKKSKPSKAARAFEAHMQDDLATPAALAFLWESLKDDSLSAKEKLGLVETADRHFGLSLLVRDEKAPAELMALAKKREEARKNKDFKAADEFRIHIEERGYRVDDTPSGPVLSKINR
jgi:cysteinyl-tRNA synthetase